MPDHAELAARLRAAYISGSIAPLRDGLRPDDLEGAYAIQQINTHVWVEAGRRVVGRKIGLTSAAVQAQLGVSQPDFGVLFADMQTPDGGRLDPARTIQPKVEAEIALVLGRPLPDPNVTLGEVAAAVASVHAALEIVDSRIADWKITFADTVADNGSSAFFVLSEQGKPLSGLDLYTAGMVMEVDGAVASLGAGAAVLGPPLQAAAWLAATVARHGHPLQAGDVLLTGALGPMVALRPGSRVRAIVGGIGETSFTFGQA